MNNWANKIVRCIELGTSDSSLLTDLEDILSWHNSASKGGDELSQSLLDKYGEHELNIRFEEFLDRLVVADNSVGEMFPASLPADQAKKRYRQLIRIFHPDRGAKEEVWLNYRAERVNKAYEYYQLADQEVVARIDSVAAVKSAKVSSPKKKAPVKFTYRPSVWRKRLGDARDVQRKMIFGLVIVSILLLLTFLVPTAQKAPVSLGAVSLQQGATVDEQGATQESERIPGLSASSKSVLDEAEWLEEEASSNMDFDFDEEAVAEVVQPKPKVTENESPEAGKEVQDQSLMTNEWLELGVQSVEGTNSPKVESETISKAVGTEMNTAGISKQHNRLSVCLEPAASKTVSASERKVVVRKPSEIREGPDLQCKKSKMVTKGNVLSLSRCTLNGLWCQVVDNASGLERKLGWLLAADIGLPAESSVVSKVGGNKALPNQTVVAKNRTEQAARKKAKQEELARAERVKRADAVRAREEARVASAKAKSSVDKSVEASREVTPQVMPAATAQLVSTATEPDIKEVIAGLLVEYTRYFESGDHSGLAGLFMSSARENKMRGADAILNYYRRAFKTTSNRQFQINIDNLEAKNEASAVATGRLTVAADMSKSGKRDRAEANYRMVLLKIEGKYKIAVFEWKRA